MTNKQVQLGKLYTECKKRKKRIISVGPNKIRKECAKARTWAASSAIPLEDAVNTLVMKKGNGVADIDWEATRLRKVCKQDGVHPKDKFGQLIEEILHTAATRVAITKAEYMKWRKAFNEASNAEDAKVAINRLVFSCFPTQFCSVIKEDLLRDVCGVLKRKSAIDFNGVDVANIDWFDLCSHAIPRLREAMPDKDYAEISSFLAAIGEICEDSAKKARKH